MILPLPFFIPIPIPLLIPVPIPMSKKGNNDSNNPETQASDVATTDNSKSLKSSQNDRSPKAIHSSSPKEIVEIKLEKDVSGDVSNTLHSQNEGQKHAGFVH